MSADLITWLRAQLDEDEQVAREASCGPWRADVKYARVVRPYSDPLGVNVGEFGIAEVYGSLMHDGRAVLTAAHISRWDPARVMLDVAAQRRIIDAYADAIHMHRAMSETDDDGKWDWLFKEEALEGVVKILALPYAYRAGYREEWKP